MAVRAITTVLEMRSVISQPKLTVVDFFATWCGPCKMIAPQLNDMAAKKPNVNFLKVDVDQAQELAAEYQISAMPTFMCFKDGQKVGELQGADINRLTQLIEEHEVLPPPQIPDDEALKGMSVRQLLTLMKQHHIPSAGLPEKQDLVDELKKYR